MRVDCVTFVDQTNVNEGVTDNGVALISGSFSKIRMTSNTSYISRTPDAIHTTPNEVYCELAQNATSVTYMGMNIARVADSNTEDVTTKVGNTKHHI